MDQAAKEYGDEALDGLVPPSHASSSDDDDNNNAFATATSPYAPKPQKNVPYYLATLTAFVIIYRTEVILGSILAISTGIAISSSYKHKHPKLNPFKAAHITHDYAAVTSKYDLTLGNIDHWCLRGDDNNCRCEDPLEPMSKRSSHKWQDQHTENIKVAQAAQMNYLQNDANSAWNNYGDYDPEYDDMWLEGREDDWIDGEGARFADDDMGYNPFGNAWEGEWEEDDDAYAVDMEREGDRKLEVEIEQSADVVPETRNNLRKLVENAGLDVVFVGDSITEQRQGTALGRPREELTGIKEVFDKTFTKDKGGDFNGVAMGIAGDTANNLLWRLGNGEMPYGLTPRVWWVGIGINDITMKGCSEEVVLLGILRVVEEIQNRHPDDTIVINSLLPINRNTNGLLEHFGKHHEDIALKKKEKDLLDSEMSNKRTHMDLWPSIVSVNEALSTFASEHKKVKFFNADQVFVEERQDGKYLKLDLMGDPVHPNLAGHKKWNNAIKKRLHEILDGK